MLAPIIRAALRHPWLLLALALALLGAGAASLRQASYDVFPEFVPTQAQIQTEAPGLAAEQVEQRVTQPLENALNGTLQVVAVRSASSQGLSVIDVVFERGVDPFRSRQLLAERLVEAAANLPAGTKAPALGAMTSSTMDLLKIGFLSDRLSPMALRSLIETVVRPRLLGVPGVARATLFGGEVRELSVRLRAEQLAAYGLSIDEVLAAVRSAGGVRGAGFVDSANQRIVLETQGQADTPSLLAQSVVSHAPGGRAVTLGDVAQVDYTAAPAFGDMLVQGRPGVMLATASQYGSNTLDVTRRAEAALAELQPLLDRAGVQMLPALHRPASFVETALSRLRDALLLGAGLVAAVLLLFLRDWRAALVSFVTIPLALLVAVLAMRHMGWTLNVMTLGGLAVALGVVVDDAIVDVENILRRLRQAPAQADRREVILAASMEVRRPVVLATAVVGLVFVPVLFLPGLQGSFFAPLAAAFLLAVVASLGLALCLVPALCLLLLRGQALPREPRWLRRLKLAQRRLLRAAQRHTLRLLAVGIGLGVLAVAALAGFEAELLPAFRERHFVVQLSTTPGTSLAAMRRIGERLSQRMLGVAGVASVSLQIGRASASEDAWGPERAEAHVELQPGIGAADEERIDADLRGLLAQFPGLQSEVLTFLGDRISESLSGETAPFALNLFGSDLDLLDLWAARIAGVLGQLPAAADVRISTAGQLPALRVRLDPPRLAAQGLRALDLLDTLSTAYAGSVVNQVQLDGRSVDVRVSVGDAQQAAPETIGELALRTPDGRRIALASVADVDLAQSRALISHEGARRRQVITAVPAAHDVVAFTARAQTAVAALPLPPGLYVEFAGNAPEAAAARADLARHCAFAAAGIVLLLCAALRERRSVVLILLNVPFALFGGVLALAAAGAVLSMGALVGFVALFGISARNALMLVSHYEHMVLVEGARWNLATAMRGAHERLTPILMTALVTGLGVLPLALGNGEAGREIEGPMAIVILGGLVSSTLLNLLLLPLLAARFLRPHAAVLPADAEASA